MLTDDALVAVRDPYGFRPLVLGRLDGAWVVASETCAFDLIGAEFERDLEPGEVVVIRRGRLRTLRPFARRREAFCVFEYIYFARPGLEPDGRTSTFRKRAGPRCWRASIRSRRTWWCRCSTRAARPRSATPRSRASLTTALIRNHYVRRTFIEPAQSIRHFGVKVKHNPVREVLDGKRVVLVDDSIVRGTTLAQDRRACCGRPARARCTAHLVAADDRPLPLRHRHADARGADRAQHHASTRSAR